VTVVVNGGWQVVEVADAPRDDLRAAGIGDGGHAFVVTLPIEELRDGELRLAALAGPERVLIPPTPRFELAVSPGSPWQGVDLRLEETPPSPNRLDLVKTRSAAGLAEVRARPRIAWAALVALLVVASWPLVYIEPGAGLDNSWAIGLNIAVQHGLAFGNQVVFTYGPLGFVANPTVVTPGLFRVALLVAIVLQALLVLTLLVCLRRSLSTVGAALIAVAAASLIGLNVGDFEAAIAFGGVSLALAAEQENHVLARWLAIGGALLAAFTILVKLDSGLAVLAIVLCGVLASVNARRNLKLAGAVFIFATLALWLLLGQPLDALPAYVRNGYEVVHGYVDVMGHNEYGAAGEWLIFLVIGSAVAFSVAAWRLLPHLGRRRQLGLIGAILIFHYLLFREMFVRYDHGHAAYVVLLLALAACFPWPRGRAPVALMAMLVVLTASLAVVPQTPLQVVDVVGRAHQFARDLHVAATPSPTIDLGRSSIIRDDAVPAAVVSALRGRCVAAEPWEIAAIWAYGLRWCPLPVIQSYNAYTARLDQLNAGAYANPRAGPSGVLRQIASIDGRNPTWESPAAQLALLCNFKDAAHGAGWEALVRTSPRCGPRVTVATIHTHLGATVQLQAAPAGDLLVAKLSGLGIGPVERVETLFWRADPRTVTIDGQTFRVPPDTADDGYLIYVPPAADFPKPFQDRFHSTDSISAVIPGDHGALTITEIAMPIAAP